jgi:hypothetical protein
LIFSPSEEVSCFYVLHVDRKGTVGIVEGRVTPEESPQATEGVIADLVLEDGRRVGVSSHDVFVAGQSTRVRARAL